MSMMYRTGTAQHNQAVSSANTKTWDAFPKPRPLWPTDRSFLIDALCALITLWLIFSTKEKS